MGYENSNLTYKMGNLDPDRARKNSDLGVTLNVILMVSEQREYLEH